MERREPEPVLESARTRRSCESWCQLWSLARLQEGHRLEDQERDEQEEEEWSWLASKVGNEVQDEVHARHIDNLERQVENDAAQGVG